MGRRFQLIILCSAQLFKFVLDPAKANKKLKWKHCNKFTIPINGWLIKEIIQQ